RDRPGTYPGPSQPGLFRRDRGTKRNNQLLQLARVGVEAADALGELVGRHRVLVVLPAEVLLVHVDPGRVGALRRFRRELALDAAFGLRQLLQQIRRDRQQVAAGEGDDLPGLAEARAHHLRLVAVLLVVVVDARHRGDAGVVFDGNVFDFSL